MPSTFPLISATGLGVVTLRPFPDVAPFSLRSGATYESIQYSIYTWLRDELIPYLNDNSAQVLLQQSIDTVTDAVNKALGAQAATVNAALNAAVQQVVTANIPITAALFETMGVHIAPLPLGNGQDDTAALLAVIAPVHAIGGTVQLRAGTYLVNLDLAHQFQQVRIVGAGQRATILKAFDKTKPVVKFNGGSGSVGGGGIEQLSITSADGAASEGIALAFSGTTGCKAKDVRIYGSFQEGVRFWNERGANGSGDFTEFNTFEGDISGCTQPVRYQVTNGVESFHGSGLVGNTTINIPTTCTEIIYVDKNGLPYNAPMSFTVWLKSTQDTRLFRIGSANRADNRHVSFHGTIRVENHGLTAGYEMGVVDAPAKCNVLYAGEIMWLGTGDMLLGNIYLCNKIGYEGGTVWGFFKPYSTRATLKNTPTIISTAGEASALTLFAVHIQGTNYEYHALWLVQRSQFDGTQAFMVELARTQFSDSGNKGAPTITFNNALYASNPNFDSTFKAYVGVTHLSGGAKADWMTQRAYT